MSDLFFNKIAAAVLVSAIGFIGINKLAAKMVQADIPEPSAFAYRLAPVETTAVETVVEIPFPSATWISGQDVAKGAKVFKKCTSCHTADNSGKKTTGPALWNIIGHTIGTQDGYNYSSAMAGHGGTWGYGELDAFLTKPKNFVPKTKMAFNGIKKETDRAALIEFLRLKADAPVEPLREAAPIPGAPIEAALETIEEAAQEGEAAIDTTVDTVQETLNDSVEEIEEEISETVEEVEN